MAFINIAGISVLLGGIAFSVSGAVHQLALDSTIAYALKESYQIKRLEIEVTKTQLFLNASRANLKTKIVASSIFPDWTNESRYNYDGTSGQYTLGKNNTLNWETRLAIIQPFIFMKYPTNGYFSLNTTTGLFQQHLDNALDNPDYDFFKDWNRTYQNKIYLQYDQPLFQPNRLKNDLESAELNFTESKFRYASDRANIINSVSLRYYDLFDRVCLAQVGIEQVELIDKAIASLPERRSVVASAYADSVQLVIARNNVTATLLDIQTQLSMGFANLKQSLRMPAEDSIWIHPAITISTPSLVLDSALSRALRYNPNVKRQALFKRKAEINLDNQKGTNFLNVKVSARYGLESSDPTTEHLNDRYKKMTTVSLRADLPLWDWGERELRLKGYRKDIDRTALDNQEFLETLQKDIATALANATAYQARFATMQKSATMSFDLCISSIDNYKKGILTTNDLTQIIASYYETLKNRSNAYQGYRKALLALMMYTFYDFEKELPL